VRFLFALGLFPHFLTMSRCPGLIFRELPVRAFCLAGFVLYRLGPGSSSRPHPDAGEAQFTINVAVDWAGDGRSDRAILCG